MPPAGVLVIPNAFKTKYFVVYINNIQIILQHLKNIMNKNE